MASTNFVDKQTVIQASWLNDVNTKTYADSSDTVAYTPAGTGAVATTVQAKLRESVSVKDFGAASGNTPAANATAISSAVNSAAPLLSWVEQTETSSAVLPVANQKLLNANIKGDLSGNFLVNTVYDHQDVIGAVLDGSIISGTGSHGVGATGGSKSQTRVLDSKIDVEKYGVLLNYDSLPTGSTSQQLIVSGNFISSGADGVELNGQDNDIKYNVINGNVINAGINGTPGADAFGVGLSSTTYSSVTGNVIPESNSRALHVEDKQKGTTLVGNAGATDGDGIYVVQDPATDSETTGVVGVGNHLTHTAASATSAGISLKTAATRGVTRSVFVGNNLVGFNYGADVNQITGSNTAKVGQNIIDSNVFDGSATAMRVSPLQNVHGHNIAVAPTTLFDLGSKTSAGRISSTAAPANIISRSDATFPGAFCRGFDFPVAFSHPGAAYTDLIMFPVGDRMQGDIVCRGDAGTSGGWWCSATILWDGTTLTITNILRHLSGNAVINGTTPFRVTTGNLCAYVTYPTPYSSTMYVDFSGVYYKI